MTKKPLPADEADLWRAMLVAGKVAPLRKKKRLTQLAAASPPIAQTPPPKRFTAKLERPSAPEKRTVPSAPTAAPLPELARKDKKKIAKGRTPIEATLDLHGMRQEEAHRAVAAFIARACTAGRKTVRIITGKGKAGEEGVLKKNLARWLAADGAMKKNITSFSQSAAHHGGAGAFYVVLKRRPK